MADRVVHPAKLHTAAVAVNVVADAVKDGPKKVHDDTIFPILLGPNTKRRDDHVGERRRRKRSDRMKKGNLLNN